MILVHPIFEGLFNQSNNSNTNTNTTNDDGDENKNEDEDEDEDGYQLEMEGEGNNNLENQYYEDLTIGDFYEPLQVLQTTLKVINKIGFNSTTEFTFLWDCLIKLFNSKDEKEFQGIIGYWQLKPMLLKGLISLQLLFLKQEIGNPLSNWNYYQNNEKINYIQIPNLIEIRILIEEIILKNKLKFIDNFNNFFNNKIKKYLNEHQLNQNPKNKTSQITKQKDEEIKNNNYLNKLINNNDKGKMIDRIFILKINEQKQNHYQQLNYHAKLNLPNLRKIIFQDFENFLQNLTIKSSILLKEYLNSFLELSDLLTIKEFERIQELFEKTLLFGIEVNNIVIQQYSILGICQSISITGKIKKIESIFKIIKKVFEGEELNSIFHYLKAIQFILNSESYLLLQPMLPLILQNLINLINSKLFFEKNQNYCKQISQFCLNIIRVYNKESISFNLFQKLITNIITKIIKKINWQFFSYICLQTEKLLLLNLITINDLEKFIILLQFNFQGINPNYYFRLFSLLITCICYLNNQNEIEKKKRDYKNLKINSIKETCFQIIFCSITLINTPSNYNYFDNMPIQNKNYTHLISKLLPNLLMQSFDHLKSIELIMIYILSKNCKKPIYLATILFNLINLIKIQDQDFDLKLKITRTFMNAIDSVNNLTYSSIREKNLYFWKFSILLFCSVLGSQEIPLFDALCVIFKTNIQNTEIFPLFLNIITLFLSKEIYTPKKHYLILLKINEKLNEFSKLKILPSQTFLIKEQITNQIQIIQNQYKQLKREKMYPLISDNNKDNGSNIKKSNQESQSKNAENKKNINRKTKFLKKLKNIKQKK
ncbi:gata zinc finger domain-containing protein 10-related [Anaeramoeba flamelloides]|uniref:Gata zinc finger domain-containing protein 10-related n=1 Tax=Anaeramoeba flamelloides TaxID=1746091 RepID=A0AAV7Y787_9EUKA|nr:gata zinc finger domain-containing protein 10-related [Anaeramoeba flamelloides]